MLLWLHQDTELEKMRAEMEGLKQTVQEKEAEVKHLLPLYHAMCIKLLTSDVLLSCCTYC